MKYKYNKIPYIFNTNEITCSKCNIDYYNLVMKKKALNDKMMMYRCNNKSYCGFCILILEQNDPDWALGVYSSG